jgi:hypothetical protein
MGDVPLIDADPFLQCGRPANIPEAALRECLLLADRCRCGLWPASASRPHRISQTDGRLLGKCGHAFGSSY